MFEINKESLDKRSNDEKKKRKKKKREREREDLNRMACIVITINGGMVSRG